MFRFNLETLLKYRTMLEERTMLEFSEKARILDREKKSLDDITRRRGAVLLQFLEKQRGDLSSADVSAFVSYIHELKRRQQEQDVVVRRAEAETEQKRRALVEAMKKRKVMETLREKKFQAYRSDRQLKEFKETDEIGIIGHGKKGLREEMDRRS
ncbi:MAG TPA: flagellar export protein FliJ [Syntrophales bacterium]|nr:flagellar export protein FliJ [Syntrophales bacterium]HPI56661.1 flagellar export protein FliJ [Syntrophales bacterium]HPN24913.1 flagellar export protein FliJ [Syntrophales bacterium]HQM29722.1 flagellar export protein FliJ [Syntrophales bacterium]